MEIPLKANLFLKTPMQVDVLIKGAKLQHKEKTDVGICIACCCSDSLALKNMPPFIIKEKFQVY